MMGHMVKHGPFAPPALIPCLPRSSLLPPFNMRPFGVQQMIVSGLLQKLSRPFFRLLSSCFQQIFSASSSPCGLNFDPPGGFMSSSSRFTIIFQPRRHGCHNRRQITQRHGFFVPASSRSFSPLAHFPAFLRPPRWPRVPVSAINNSVIFITPSHT